MKVRLDPEEWTIDYKYKWGRDMLAILQGIKYLPTHQLAKVREFVEKTAEENFKEKERVKRYAEPTIATKKEYPEAYHDGGERHDSYY